MSDFETAISQYGFTKTQTTEAIGAINLNITGNFSVNQRADFLGDVSFQQDIDVSGTSEFDIIQVNNNSIFKEDVSINENVYIGNTLEVVNDVLFNQRMDVFSDVSLNKNVTIRILLKF